MRRSRSALTAWPAFADLMTVLAVLGLAIAAGVASVDGPDRDRIEDLEDELAAARERNAGDRNRIQDLEDQLAAARERSAGDRDRIRILEGELTAERLGSVPCLGTRPGSRTAPVPLLRIVVDAGFHLTRLWPQEREADVAAIPRIEEAIARGLMQEDDLRRYARDMYEYGNRDDNAYGGRCRFWVELRKGETTPQSAFSRARSIVEQYFLLSNSSEVIRILAAAQ